MYKFRAKSKQCSISTLYFLSMFCALKGTPKGELVHGFQIWINVPSEKKMDDPSYGTEPSSKIPSLEKEGVVLNVLAGPFKTEGFEAMGPFKTTVNVQMLDISIQPDGTFTHILPVEYDNCLIYVFKGSSCQINKAKVSKGNVIRLNATDKINRMLTFSAGSGSEELRLLLFAGKMLNQPIAWHGPFVMTTQQVPIKQT